MGLKSLRAKRPTASTWDKIRARRPDETLSNRDVHGDQQLDRSTLGTRRSRTPGFIGAAITGAAVFALAWLVYSILATLFIGVFGALGGVSIGAPAEQPYHVKTQVSEGGTSVTCYKQITETGSPDPGGKCYGSAEEVPKPDWYQEESETKGTDEPATTTVGAQLATVTGFKLFMTVGTGLAVALVISTLVTRRVSAENLMHDTDDINQHQNDQHIALPEEIMEKFDYFPDAGAHSAVQVSSVISHTMLKKKGLGTVDLVERAEDDIVDEDGEILYYAGDPLEDTDGNVKTRTVPLIDEDFGKALFEASGVPDVKGGDGKALRKRFDTTVIPYNPDGKAQGKLGKYETVADLIMDDWTFPGYEVQRPAGTYIVDTAPVNTMVLAITRGGKGQTIIEPTLDMWSREKRPSNMIINDPKGELLVKNYVPFVMRGFEPVQFNLINPVKTNIYNPLGMAADAAREGDSTKCAQYVENIADVFFPVSGGEDPVWPKAAGNSSKRVAYGLIDFYMEEERELREFTMATDMPPEALEQRLDEMWGKVTLYNCYQMFVQLTSKKMKNPEVELEKRVKKGEFDNDEEGLQAEQRRVEAQSPLWEGKPEQDMLTLYFNATAALPTNTVRTLIGNADNALRAMAGAEKMIASVYGIALTAMSFFSDPTISRLTSGRPSQTTDFGSLSFPRRMGVRFSQNYLKRDNLMREMLAKWSAYSDPMFSASLGKDFDHQDVVTPEGWARYYFEGKFPTDEAWVKLELVDAQKQMLVRTFYFYFKKSYQLSLNGRHFVKEQVTGEKIVKDGVIRELRPVREGGKADGTILSFESSNTTYPQDKLNLADSVVPERVQGRARAIQQTMVRYSEKTKAVFLVTPPHLTKYAQIVLILIKQLVDLNFDKSYMTKSNQKPLYKTRFMLDELGNLSSDGEGIQSFQTMLSIGLGQEQQFTLILQTLQQLRDVYGDSVDKIVQGNTSNIIFLKSTDDSMLETLEKMSGKTHRVYRDSKQITQDMNKVIGGKTQGAVSYTMSTQEEPLIKFNDMYFIPERNSIVFRAGDAPVWNRNETILPMSWRLFKNTIRHAGHDEYTLQTIPTLSTAVDFDVKLNQPDFKKLLDKRITQAMWAGEAKQQYQDAYGYEDIEIARLDPDLYADEVMEIIRGLAAKDQGLDPDAAVMMDPDDYEASIMFDDDQFIENVELAAEVHDLEADESRREERIYAEGLVSKEMLVHRNGVAKLKTLDVPLAEAYKHVMLEMQHDDEHFSIGGDGELRSTDGSVAYISPMRSATYSEAAQRINGHLDDEGSRAFAEQELTEEDLRSLATVKIHSAFYQYLASLESWEVLADGAFDRAMAVEMRQESHPA
ncbi:type IV secretory system conjugative DNA transfer family protein [Nocardiopsis sp. JB363]|uniref:type IV secretory system conjugative DNA transfer family protein n=1 Tax=Nocardiopsis sp. JB363 TaxID=1434837 RepID=UPI00097AE997|nr:type IV secretory system conjugative DNA transfer family protein [Nocardiopsis sp. JB363]SIO86940.1 CONSERVED HYPOTHETICAL PROTEIN-PLASMID ENCODED [Nocardiopsis sp. JB363]